MPELTQSRLKELLHYNPDTGAFTWISKSHAYSNDCIGNEAGWYRGGYLYIGIDNKQPAAHLLAWLYMTGAMPEDQVDHQNHKKDDNRWSNIRAATNKINGRNLPFPARNTSGFVGVTWRKSDKTWQAAIKVDGKSIYLGRFDKKKDAIDAREKANLKYGFHENHGLRSGE